jgi:hypothetical protein
LTDNLGNAYLTSFFVTGGWDHTRLSHSLKAYQNAVSMKRMDLILAAIICDMIDMYLPFGYFYSTRKYMETCGRLMFGQYVPGEG